MDGGGAWAIAATVECNCGVQLWSARVHGVHGHPGTAEGRAGAGGYSGASRGASPRVVVPPRAHTEGKAIDIS